MSRIVLIEDDDLMCEWLGRLLSSRGHEVDRYRRADEAVEAVSADPPDVVVSDVHMPGISGIDFAHVLRARGIAIPIVMMTADPTDALAARAASAGARCLLRKPFDDASQLWTAVEAAAAAEHSSQDELASASHALRTPLTAIRMALDALTTGRALNAREQNLAQIARRNLDRLTSALEDHLADFSVASEERTGVE